MSISTYSDLQTAVANWTKRSDLTSIIPDLILLGEKYLFRYARTRDMEEDLNVTISSGLAAVPADYVELKTAYIDGTPIKKLTRTGLDALLTQYPLRTGSGTAKLIARNGSNFEFGPYPADGDVLKGTYYKSLTSIQSSANALFTNNPDLYLAASLAEAYDYIRNDEQKAFWIAKRDQILASVNGLDKAETYSGGPVAVQVA